MWNPFKKRLLKFKSLLVDEKYKIIPAFVLGNKQYYQFSNVMDMPTSRGLSAMWIYEEFKMKCDERYLKLHVEATNKILSGDKGKIDLNILRQINQNLGERLSLAAVPDHCYKLASVHFFDAEESIFIYDKAYNDKKIELWKKNPEALSFFLSQPLKDYLPFSDMQSSTVETYLKVVEKITEMHQGDLQAVLSKRELTTDLSN